ncbi:MAG: hypothetical protein JNM11_07040 [Chitinimonas sp.]|nr:hypothetical protein [Chitinimonas sp.]
MRTWKQTLIGALFAVAAVAAQAHGNHADAPISKDGAEVRSGKVIDMLVDAKKLPASWKMTKVKEATSRQTPNGPIWVISYQNPTETDAAKRNLFVFFDETGNYIGANHTGDL